MSITTSQGRGGDGVSKPVGAIPRGRRVVVTGMGCVTVYGSGVECFWQNLILGRSGIRPLTAFDPTPYGTRVAGQIPNFRPADFMSQKVISGSARCTQLGVVAARMALEDARLSIRGADSRRIGVFFGTSVGTFSYAA